MPFVPAGLEMKSILSDTVYAGKVAELKAELERLKKEYHVPDRMA